MRSGGVSLLLRLVEEGTASGKEAAAGALQNLAIDEDISMAVERAGGLHLVVELLWSEDEDCRQAGGGGRGERGRIAERQGLRGQRGKLDKREGAGGTGRGSGMGKSKETRGRNGRRGGGGFRGQSM